MTVRTGTLVSLAVVVLLVIPLTAYWALVRSPISKRELAQLRPGMSKQEVQAILGAPNGEWPDGTFAHSKPLGWPVVLIFFDDNNLLKEIDVED